MTSTKRLYRSRDDRMIAGVASGLAEYCEIDPVLVRVAFVVLCFAWFIGALIYAVLWILVPEAPRRIQIQPDDQGQGTENPEPVEAGEGHAEAESAESSSREVTVMSEAGSEGSEARPRESRFFAGAILIAVGIIFLVQNFFPDRLRFDRLWPVLLIAIGVLLIAKTIRRGEAE
ncbi:MAG: PspC domain-containing protein [Candidatus Bipolaricaulia bacterium]